MKTLMTALVVILVFSIPVFAEQQGRTGGGTTSGYSGYGMGPGMMGGYGYGMGPGMMGSMVATAWVPA